MAVVEELLRAESDGTISFGNHTLAAKAKKEDYEHGGNLYKVKTFKELTKLEKNGMFAYESEPGTSVNAFCETEEGLTFTVEGDEDAQITVGLLEDTAYTVYVNGVSVGEMKTNLSGKLSISVELSSTGKAEVRIVK
ncbi:MAG: endosialidase [Bacteroidales bacterium]|nr:endosialidase [Bacteroidales bacterium]MCM1416830.1 endosialidase [bacterium]MCM1422411.1 endosialidase [bacterium]